MSAQSVMTPRAAPHRAASRAPRAAARPAAGPRRAVTRAEKVVGIDLGTTNSAVAAMEGKGARRHRRQPPPPPPWL